METLNRDLHLLLFSLLSVPDLLSLSQCSKRVKSAIDANWNKLFYSEPVRHLKTLGVAVIPALLDSQRLPHYREEMLESFKTFPEYKDHSMYVLGSFGAFGNPASFHTPVVRNLRRCIGRVAKGLFKEFTDDKSIYIEQLFDRTSLRKSGTKTGAESWHRDRSPCGPEDLVFGGWLNLDSEDQYFSCVPSTHVIKTGTPGFVKCKGDYTKDRQTFKIPGGHWIIFHQTLVHEVLSVKQKHDSLRQYVGFRLTKDAQPLFDHDDVMLYQGVPKIPSGQIPPLYAANHLSYHQQKTITWSEKTFKKECLVEKTNKTTLTKYIVVERFMQSLTDYDFPKYPKYTEGEMKVMRPQKLHNVFKRIRHELGELSKCKRNKY